MIEYIVAQNPDDRILKRAGEFLAQGKIISFPSDTNWLLVCDVFQAEAVRKIYQAKHENPHHHFSLLCGDIKSVSEVALLSDLTFRWMKRLIPGPYTFILEANKLVSKSLKASHRDHEVGVRIPDCGLLRALAKFYPGPLLSTNIHPAMLGVSEEDIIYGLLIEEELGPLVSMVLDPGETTFVGPSTILDLRVDGAPQVLRYGSGPVPF
ncbi:MAG: threonylcarbamoyl-AMP synthase [Bdellovibrionales bacterium GWA2_49_15]|nr:MAG: threonylcarbamoyl-AMP synthase [Bdellovibrionales bacterium GWA2_49_15]HAZ11461.1 threonylcarbamoyl-AMP synthase [Bdellovibrionales bacterium]